MGKASRDDRHSSRYSWGSRHTAALQAWEQGDVDSLCKACDLEIRTAIRKTIGNNPELKDIEGIQEELRSFARKGIEKAAERYDPSRRSFQAYAWQDIYWETRRGAAAFSSQLEHEIHEGEPGPDDMEVAAVQERPAMGRRLAAALHSLPTDDWIEIIEDLDRDLVRWFSFILEASRDELIEQSGRPKYTFIRYRVFLKQLTTARNQPGARLREISGPRYLMMMERAHKGRDLLAPPLSNRELARNLVRSDKTIKAWKERIERAGSPPPTLRDDGSLSMKGEHLNHWILYLAGIVDPRLKRRLERRHSQEELD